MKASTQRIFALFKASTIYSIGNVLNKALLFLMVPLYAHHILPEDLSLLAVLDPAEQFLYALVHLGLTQAFYRYFGNREEPGLMTRLVSTTFWFAVAMALLVVSLLVLFADPVIDTLLPRHPLAQACYYLTLASLALRLMNMLGAGYLQAERRAGLLSGLVIAGTLLFVGYNVVQLAVLGAQVDAVFEARLLLMLPPIAGGLWLLRPYLRFRFDARLFGRMLRFSYPFILSAAAYPILNFFDRWMLERLVDAMTTGIYDLSYRFGMIPGMVLVAPFLRVWQPAIYDEADEQTQHEVYQRVLLYYTLAGCLLWLGLAVYSRELLELFAQPVYVPGHRIIPYVAASQFFYGLGWIVMAGLAVQSKTFFIGTCTFAAALLNVALNYWLIPVLGMLGAAVATLAAFVALFVGFAVYAHLRLPLRWPYGRLAAMLGVSLAAFFLVKEMAWGGFWEGILWKAVLLLPAAGLLAWLAGLDATRLRALWATRRKG